MVLESGILGDSLGLSPAVGHEHVAFSFLFLCGFIHTTQGPDHMNTKNLYLHLWWIQDWRQRERRRQGEP